MTRHLVARRRTGAVLGLASALVVHLTAPAAAAPTTTSFDAASELTVTEPPAQHSFPATETPSVSGWVRLPPATIGTVDVVLTNLDTQVTYSAQGVESRAPQRTTLTTADDGSWVWRPGFRLAAGSYSVTARAPAITTDVVTVAFSVSAESGPSFVTLLLGRSRAGVDPDAAACGRPGLVSPGGNRLSLAEVARKARSVRAGVTFTGTVITSDANAPPDGCSSETSWDHLAELRDDYGWSFVSQGKEYVTLPNRAIAYPYGTAQSQSDNICGSLDDLAANGHTRAWGMFAYPDGNGRDDVARYITTECFAFGRIYQPGVNTRGLYAAANGVVAPDLRYVRATSVLGGRCADVSLPCSHLTVRNNRSYMSPRVLQRLVGVGPGQWAVVQVYVLAEGFRIVPPEDPTAHLQWDCRGSGPAHWDQHWTSRPEIYCWNDLADVIQSIPASATVTDPATVAEVWGVVPDRLAASTACEPSSRACDIQLLLNFLRSIWPFR